MTGWIAILDGLAGRLRADTLDDLPQPAWSLTAGLAGWIRRRRTALTQLRDRLHEQLVALEASVATPEEQAPHPARVHSPPLVTTPPSTPGMLVGQGLVGGRAVGVGAPPPLPAGDDALVLIARDGDPALTPELLRARALVLLGGGALSHLATTALELGLPTVLCPGAEPAWPAETSLEVDGDLGVVRPVNP